MAKLKLTDREWASFFIGGENGIFNIEATQSGIDKNKLKTAKDGKTPYITRSETDNGINLFVPDEQMRKYKKDDGNVITIGLDTQTVFYQKNSFWTGQNIQILKNDNLNYWVAMFLIPLLKIQMEKFSWGGNGATLGRLNRTQIMLPIYSDYQPDWQFMEDYIKQKEEEKIKQLIDYYTQQATDILIQTASITDREWKAFPFNEIFEEIQRGKRLTKSNQIEGDIPYISSSATQNGVDNFISNEKNVRKFGNCLTIANSGSVGATFFHHYQFIASDHVTELKLERPNKYVYLFLASIIKRLEEKYSFNREINDKRIQREKILLPINDNTEPDWQFMEDFIRQLEKNKIETILKYYNTMINNEKSERGGVAHLLKDYKWSAFKISDICEIFSGVRLTKQDMNEGETPFIGASDSNNGVTAFINNHNASVDSDVLGVNYNGSVVENFYHPYQALFSDDVKRVKIKNYQGKYAYLFLKTAILKQKKKYQYGYKFNATRMAKQKILLPVNHLNQPDWEGMEIYMQRLELQKITQYIKSLHNPKSRILTNN
ncbi:restriction endonuclease subunit S [Avibacterium paragallinarum]|uniref:restriction endonuclease subunit S n=1 Tax=Avibacterium paragallinarum TaxID=728 RepID=UPI0003576595|nr:restriction endonuclease subunit S [Avibacterium paragallinarum]POY45956.1 restriction endonuclease [Avibacterium paragallinarum]RZN75364.1 restriction endonuclease [Avibacterium paragallinarum]CDF98458.1 Putative Restriction enzyme [Avibacterium paragallinarum JF4211]